MSSESGQPVGRWWAGIRPHAAVIAFFCVLLLALSLQNRVTDADFWWHLRTGRWIVEEARIPRADLYSFTMPGEPWIAHSWLAEVVMYLLYRYVGPFSLPLLRSLLHVAAYGLLLRLVWERWPRLGGALGLVLLSFVASAKYWLVRPNSLSLALFIGLLFLWERYKRHGRNWYWVLPPLMVLWANLHSGYIYGFLLLGCLFIGERVARRFWPDPAPLDGSRWARMGLMILLSAVAVMINPYGARLLLYPFQYYLGGITLHTHYVGEWLSPDFHQPSNLLFALLLLLLIGALAWRRTSMAPAETLALLLFVYLSLRSIRAAGVTIPLLAWSVAGILGHGVAPRPGAGRRGAWLAPSRGIQWAWNVGVVLLLLLLLAAVGGDFVRWGQNEGYLGEDPALREVVDVLETYSSSNRLFNSYNMGGYVIWRLFPDRPVFIDGRADLYGDAVFTEYLAVWQGDATWAEVLRQWDIRLVLCEPQTPLTTLLIESPSWDSVYRNQAAALFRRVP